jgi:O-antigen/teichoic acid export membrane protein
VTAVDAAAATPSSLRRSVAGASTLALVGRGVGLVWTVALVARLGLGDYGLYAMAFSASSLLAGVVDSPFLARSGRVDEAGFARDCTLRAWGGTLCLAAALGCLAAGWYVPGFATLLAGGEAALGVVKAEAHRQGRPGTEQALDLARQGTSIACGMAALLALGKHHLLAVSLAYAMPYGVAAAGALRRSVGRPRGVPVREFLSLSATSLVGAGYAQLDVVLVGGILGSKAAGAYALASLAAWALALPGLQYATSRLPELRRRATADPRVVGRVTTAGLCLGAVCLAAPLLASLALPSQLTAARCLALLSPFVATRTVNWYLSTVAVQQRRDTARLGTTGLSLAADVGLLLALVPVIGVMAAPVAAVGADLVLLAGFARTTGCALRGAHLVALGSLALLAAAAGLLMSHPWVTAL